MRTCAVLHAHFTFNNPVHVARQKESTRTAFLAFFDRFVHMRQLSDMGGGIPRRGMAQIFTYLYTTAELPADMQLMDAADTVRYSTSPPIAHARLIGDKHF
jgi:hypothetical protein